MDRIAYASPVVLARQGRARWSGEVTPLDDELTLFLVVKATEDGSVSAFLRNPERNFGIRFAISHVVREGNLVRFVGKRRFAQSDADEVLVEGTYRLDAGQLSVYMGEDYGTFDFSRTDEDSASPFYPRARDARPYTYRQPTPAHDGWTTGSLDDVEMDSKPIRDLVRTIIDTPTTSVFSPYVHALLVARHGTLVVEEYFHGFHREKPHDTRSASKSLTSTLVGVALHEGAPFEIASPVYALMNGGAIPPGLEPRKRALTVEHLLTMTSGFDCDDNDSSSPGYEDTMQSQTDEPDWSRYTLGLPMAREPGEHAVYCSANSNLAGAVLGRATGTWLPEYFSTRFAEPLHIERYHMNLTPTGEAYMGGGIYWLARDFLKLGQLMLDGGLWRGRRLLSKGWVRRATSPLEDLNAQRYGYSWWVISYPYQGRTVRAFYAGGNGGQLVIVIPELDLAVLFFAGNYSHFASLVKLRDEYVADYILRAVK